MSFESLSNDLLRQAAEEFAVDVQPTDTKKMLVSKIMEAGVNFDMYKQAFPDPMEEPDLVLPDATELQKEFPLPVPVPKRQIVLLKMERANPSFAIRGYNFTKAHPFLPVEESDAAYIIHNEDGFRVALPSEAEAFYS